MTVGEMIALLCKHAVDKDDLLMVKSIDSIEIDEDGISLYFHDANTPNYIIKSKIKIKDNTLSDISDMETEMDYLNYLDENNQYISWKEHRKQMELEKETQNGN